MEREREREKERETHITHTYIYIHVCVCIHTYTYVPSSTYTHRELCTYFYCSALCLYVLLCLYIIVDNVMIYLRFSLQKTTRQFVFNIF